MRVKARLQGDRELARAFEKAGINAEEAITEIVQEATLSLQGLVIRSVQRGPAMGRTYVKYTPNRTHTASAPGQPPMTDTGDLANSIKWQMRGMDGYVFSRLDSPPYPLYLEFGTKNMQARPFFRPAVERERPKFVKRYDRLIDKVVKA